MLQALWAVWGQMRLLDRLQLQPLLLLQSH